MSVFEMKMKHDQSGRIVEKIETVKGKSIKWTYSYDKEGRLFEAHLDNRLVCQCHYDRDGRRQQDYFPRTHGSWVRNYSYTMDDRLQQAGNNGFTHDKKGFRSIWNSGGKYTLYKYAPDYRLLKAEKPEDKLVFQFTHDENGQREYKYLNGKVVEAYAWLDFIRLAGFYDGKAGYQFAYDGNVRTPYAMQREDGAKAYLYYDQIGSLRVVADESGNVIKEVLYDPFGGIIEDSNPGFRVPIGFAGGLHDQDLGFVRFGWRDYDTFTSRWTAPDPLGDAGGDDDWYGYCLDDPVNGFDPLGLFVLGGAGLATAAMGMTGLIQYAPQINQWGLAIANEFMDGKPGVVEFGKRVGSKAWDTIKTYPDVVFENTKYERERMARRAARYQKRREEDQRRARDAKAKKEEEAARADAHARDREDRRAAALAAKNRNAWGDDERDSLDGTSGNKGGDVMSLPSRNAWGDDGKDSLDGTSGNKGESVASSGGSWGDDGKDSLDGTSGNKGQSVASSGGGWW